MHSHSLLFISATLIFKVLKSLSLSRMMLRSLSVPPCIARVGPVKINSGSRGIFGSFVPFSRSKTERMVRDLPLIQKTENDVADYCSTLEGDASYSCWRGYFELKDLEKEAPKEEVEKLIIQAGGVKSLISCLHGISSMHKKKNETNGNAIISNDEKIEVKHFHVPDGLPKSKEELEEEEKSKMPDSSFTRMLRAKGKYPAWYTPAPDHETD